MAKTESKTEAATQEPFSHPDKRVYVLVPADSKERDLVLVYLEAELFPLCAKLPVVTYDLRIGKFRGDEVVYVAHPVDARVKDPVTGRYSAGTEIHVSKPVEMSQFLAEDADGFRTLTPDAVVRALSPLCKTSREGRCYYLRVSEDHICKVVNY